MNFSKKKIKPLTSSSCMGNACIASIMDLRTFPSVVLSFGLVTLTEDENAKVEVTGPGFIWDKFGHVATNYHAVAKLATDRSRFTAL
ncbi:hypothetical protein NC651_010549 [Populus alba x Populus x berolinensis]|nr:hypothetical protein NC651_010549 [Populus alba x Populus x berolinensis]